MADIFRKEYTELTDSKKRLVTDLKTEAERLLNMIEDVQDPRMKALAKTKLEECVMWAVKGVTA